MGKCVHRLNLDLIANLAHELWQTDIFAHRRHTIVAGSRCALLTDVLANLCGDILAHLLRLCHLLFSTQWHFFLIANFSRDLSAVVPGHQHANVALHVFGHIMADILCFVAALGHSHRVARLHRDNFAHVLLERHLNVLAEGRWFEGALLFLFCSSRGTFSTTHLCTSLHSFLTTLVHTFSSTCLLTLRITHRHFFTSSGAHTLVGVTLVTLLQTFFGTLAHTSSFFHSITSFASTLQTFSTFFRATSRHLLLSPSVLLLLSSLLSCPL